VYKILQPRRKLLQQLPGRLGIKPLLRVILVQDSLELRSDLGRTVHGIDEYARGLLPRVEVVQHHADNRDWFSRPGRSLRCAGGQCHRGDHPETDGLPGEPPADTGATGIAEPSHLRRQYVALARVNSTSFQQNLMV